MSDRQLRALGAVLIVLVALIALVRWNASRPETTFQPPADLKTLKDSVDKIELSSAEGSVTITKSSAGWSIDGSAADTATASKLFKTLEGAAWAEMVSSNPKNQDAFGTTGPGAKTLTFFEGSKKKVQLIVGSQTQVPNNFYATVGGSKQVWLLTGDFATIPTTAEAWRAKPAPKSKPSSGSAPAPQPTTQPK